MNMVPSGDWSSVPACVDRRYALHVFGHMQLVVLRFRCYFADVCQFHSVLKFTNFRIMTQFCYTLVLVLA
jgi:hypothetical protein